MKSATGSILSVSAEGRSFQISVNTLKQEKTQHIIAYILGLISQQKDQLTEHLGDHTIDDQRQGQELLSRLGRFLSGWNNPQLWSQNLDIYQQTTDDYRRQLADLWRVKPLSDEADQIIEELYALQDNLLEDLDWGFVSQPTAAIQALTDIQALIDHTCMLQESSRPPALLLVS